MRDLNFKRLGQGDEHIIILHGLFGMLDNWLSIAKQISADMPTVSVWLLDQRNHGKSFHSDDFNYYLLANDVLEFMDSHDIERAIVVGHSMGGKVAMQLACEHPQLVKQLIVVDIAPKSYERGHDEIFDAILNLDLTKISKRGEAEERLMELLESEMVVSFLLKNLKRGKNGAFEWKANFQSLYENYDDILINSLSPYDEYDSECLFIKGGASSRYIELDDYEMLLDKFPNAKIEIIEGAGHWVHAEKPEELLMLFKQFMD